MVIYSHPSPPQNKSQKLMSKQIHKVKQKIQSKQTFFIFFKLSSKGDAF